MSEKKELTEVIENITEAESNNSALFTEEKKKSSTATKKKTSKTSEKKTKSTTKKASSKIETQKRKAKRTTVESDSEPPKKTSAKKTSSKSTKKTTEEGKSSGKSEKITESVELESKESVPKRRGRPPKKKTTTLDLSESNTEMNTLKTGMNNEENITKVDNALTKSSDISEEKTAELQFLKDLEDITTGYDPSDFTASDFYDFLNAENSHQISDSDDIKKLSENQESSKPKIKASFKGLTEDQKRKLKNVEEFIHSLILNESFYDIPVISNKDDFKPVSSSNGDKRRQLEKILRPFVKIVEEDKKISNDDFAYDDHLKKVNSENESLNKLLAYVKSLFVLDEEKDESIEIKNDTEIFSSEKLKEKKGVIEKLKYLMTASVKLPEDYDETDNSLRNKKPQNYDSAGNSEINNTDIGEIKSSSNDSKNIDEKAVPIETLISKWKNELIHIIIKQNYERDNMKHDSSSENSIASTSESNEDSNEEKNTNNQDEHKNPYFRWASKSDNSYFRNFNKLLDNQSKTPSDIDNKNSNEVNSTSDSIDKTSEINNFAKDTDQLEGSISEENSELIDVNHNASSPTGEDISVKQEFSNDIESATENTHKHVKNKFIEFIRLFIKIDTAEDSQKDLSEQVEITDNEEKNVDLLDSEIILINEANALAAETTQYIKEQTDTKTEEQIIFADYNSNPFSEPLEHENPDDTSSILLNETESLAVEAESFQGIEEEELHVENSNNPFGDEAVVNIDNDKDSKDQFILLDVQDELSEDAEDIDSSRTINNELEVNDGSKVVNSIESPDDKKSLDNRIHLDDVLSSEKVLDNTMEADSIAIENQTFLKEYRDTQISGEIVSENKPVSDDPHNKVTFSIHYAIIVFINYLKVILKMWFVFTCKYIKLLWFYLFTLISWLYSACRYLIDKFSVLLHILFALIHKHIPNCAPQNISIIERDLSNDFAGSEEDYLIDLYSTGAFEIKATAIERIHRVLTSFMSILVQLVKLYVRKLVVFCKKLKSLLKNIATNIRKIKFIEVREIDTSGSDLSASVHFESQDGDVQQVTSNHELTIEITGDAGEDILDSDSTFPSILEIQKDSPIGDKQTSIQEINKELLNDSVEEIVVDGTTVFDGETSKLGDGSILTEEERVESQLDNDSEYVQSNTSEGARDDEHEIESSTDSKIVVEHSFAQSVVAEQLPDELLKNTVSNEFDSEESLNTISLKLGDNNDISDLAPQIEDIQSVPTVQNNPEEKATDYEEIKQWPTMAIESVKKRSIGKAIFDFNHKIQSVKMNEIDEEGKKQMENTLFIDPTVNEDLDTHHEDTQKIVTWKDVKQESVQLIPIEDKDEPIFLESINLLTRATNPIKVLESVNPNAVFSTFKTLMAMFLQFGAAVFTVVLNLYNYLNTDSFSYARMTFSDGVWLWLRLTVFLMVGAAVANFAISIYLKIIHKDIDFKDICAYQGFVSLPSTLVFFLSGIFANFGYIPSLLLFIIGMIMMLLLTTYALYKAIDVECNKVILIRIIAVFIVCIISYVLFRLYCTDLVNIYMIITQM